MKITLWKGWHGDEVAGLIASAWRNRGSLLILCPPAVTSFEFVRFLPAGSIEFIGEWPEIPDLPEREPALFPDEPVLGLFTSGTSSGEQKLVLYSRRNIRASLTDIVGFLDIDEIESVFCYPQPFHTFGLLLGYILAIEMDWQFVTGQGKYSTSYHARRLQMSTHKLLTLGTPTHFQDLMAYVKAAAAAIPVSSSCVVGGASVSLDLWDRLHNELRIEKPSVGYGATEASPGVAHLPAGQRPLEDNEIGLPLPSLKIEIQPGSGYWISGDAVCMAMVYPERIEFPDRILISDQLEARPDGVLIYRGRSDLVINRGGEKIPIEAVERVLRDGLGLEVLAFAVPHQRLGHELGLLVNVVNPSPTVIERILETLRSRFQVRFDSAFFQQVRSIPLNANHKPDRKAALRLFRPPSL